MFTFGKSSGGQSEDWLVPPNTIQYLFKGDMAEETGNGVTPTLTGTGAHRLGTNGEFIASNGSAGNTGYALVSDDSFTDSIFDTSTMSGDETLIIAGQAYYSGNPSATETIFSYGHSLNGFIVLQLTTSGSLQLEVGKSGTVDVDFARVGFGSVKYGAGAYFPFLIAIHNRTQTFDFMCGTDTEADSQIKSGYLFNDIVADSRGLCLFSDNRYGDQRSKMGNDTTITSKVRSLHFSRLPGYYNAPRILREIKDRPNRQLRTLKDAHS